MTKKEGKNERSFQRTDNLKNFILEEKKTV